jgi:hypothetical protein
LLVLFSSGFHCLSNCHQRQHHAVLPSVAVLRQNVLGLSLKSRYFFCKFMLGQCLSPSRPVRQAFRFRVKCCHLKTDVIKLKPSVSNQYPKVKVRFFKCFFSERKFVYDGIRFVNRKQFLLMHMYT